MSQINTEEERISMELVVSPDSKATPAVLHGATMQMPVDVRETCSGIVIRGKRSDVENAVNKLRNIDPYAIFIKARGSRIGLHRIYRGFLQIEGEYKSLQTFSRALEKVLGEGDARTGTILSEKKTVSPDKLSSIFEEELSATQEKPGAKGKKAYVYPVISKWRNFDVFWVCRDNESKLAVSTGTSKEEAVQKAKRIGYTEFSSEYPPFSIAPSESSKPECARMVICQCAPSAVDIDAVLILRKDGGLRVQCPLGDLCKVWCPYGEVELMACNRTKEASRLILIRGDGTLARAYIPKAARGEARYFLMTDRKNEWIRRQYEEKLKKDQ